MKAIRYERYGGPEVLELREADMPQPGNGQVLVRVHAASVNRADVHFMRGEPYFLRLMSGLGRPKVASLGFDIAGVVEAVGEGVTRFKPGDAVYGEAPGRAFAEYACASEKEIAPMPPSLSFDEAAAVPLAAQTALMGLRDAGKLEPGQHVLINGASGAVGTFAVQLGAALGAEVTAVVSTRNVETARELGAAHAVDYTREDFTTAAEPYDLVFDNVGNRSLSEIRRVLKPHSVYVPNGGRGGKLLGPIGHLVKSSLAGMFISQRVASFVEKPAAEMLEFLSELIEEGKLKPVIDRTYALADVPSALGYLEQGHTRGKVVIKVLED